MQVGIVFDKKPTIGSFDTAKYMNDREYVKSEIPLPPIAEKALDLTKTLWIQDVPLLIMDSGDHGYDRGLVFMSGTYQQVQDTDFTNQELIARVSIGGTKEGSCWSYHDPSRVHVSLYGARQFFPEKWDHLGVENLTGDLPVVEEVHISLRWIDGKYQNWDDTQQWHRNSRSRSHEKLEFHPGRCTYCQIYAGRTPMNIDYINMSAEDVETLISSLGRKQAIVPQGPKIDQFDGKWAWANTFLRDYLPYKMPYLPLLGFLEVRSTIDTIPDIPRDYKYEFSRMTQDQAVDFLYTDILKGVQTYLNS